MPTTDADRPHTADQGPDTTPRASAAPRAAFIGIAMGMTLGAVSQTLVSTALPTIVGEFGGYDSLAWVVSAYLLTSSIVVPFAGKLADMFGTTRMFRVAILVFAAGSLLAAVSQSMIVLIAARSIQGLGGGAIMTLAFTLVGRLAPARERGRYNGYIASLFALSSVLGPLVGGFFVDHLTWRLAFVTSVGLSLVALVVVQRNLPPDEARTGKRLDARGSLLLVVALATTMLVAMWGGQQFAWMSLRIIGLSVVALVSLAAFVWTEGRVEEPIVPLHLFRRRAVRVSSVLGFLSGMAMFGVIVYAPTFLQVSRGVSATKSGLLLIPLMGFITIGSAVGGRIMSRTGRFRHVAIAGSALLMVGAGLLATMSESTPVLIPSVFVGVSGLGIGLTMPVTIVAVQNAVRLDQLGAATSLTQFTRKIGSTLGVAILGGLFNAGVATSLAGSAALLPPGATADSLLDTPAKVALLPTPVASAVRSAVADGVRLTFTAAFFVAVVGLAVSTRLPDDELTDDELTDDSVKGDPPGKQPSGACDSPVPA